MKNILLSTAVAIVLGLGGCGSNNTTTTPVVTSKALDSVKSITREADATYVVAWTKDADVELLIAGGADARKFEIDNSTTRSVLKFKNDTTPEYIEGGNNEYIVEINAKDTVKNITKKVGTFKVKVPRPAVVNDTTPPVITTAATFHFTDSSSVVTLSATDNATAPDEISFAIPAGSSMFTLSGKTLSPAFDSGTNSIDVTATDKAGNSATKRITVDVNVSANQAFEISNVENNTTTWDEAEAACSAKGMDWRLPTIMELQDNNVTILNEKVVGIDSDYNSSNGVKFASVIWSSTPAEDNASKIQGLWYKEGNLSLVQELDVAKTNNYFHLCVKP
jgi:hypothetical protein